MGPYKITSCTPQPTDTILVWYDGLWRPGFWVGDTLFTVWSLDNYKEETFNGLWWSPLPPMMVE